MTRIALVGLYLTAIVTANLTLYEWGPRAAVYNAFFFIGLDLTTRDRLHDLWRGHVLRNMAALIFAGSVLSYLASLALGSDTPVASASRIAVASGVAFAAAAATDAIAYHFLRKRDWFERANWSNIAGAAVDSMLFLPLAFGGFPWQAIFALFCAKVAGGVVWSFIIRTSLGEDWQTAQRLRWGRADSRA